MRIQDLAADAAVDFQKAVFDYAPSADQRAATPPRHPVVVVGAGPVGLALAIDLAQRQLPVVLLDRDHRLASGSRAICFAKRSLEIFDRLGCGDAVVAKGVSWQRGRVFLRDEEIYHFDLLPEDGHARPAFVNLQQYYVEGFLAARAGQLPAIDLRWQHQLVGLAPQGRQVLLEVQTPDGGYRMVADWVLACDGSRSTVREQLGLHSAGRQFRDRFLIADVRLHQPVQQRAPERWFWFDPVFHPQHSVLLHMQPDDVLRIDFQLGWDADPEEARKPGNIVPRVRSVLDAAQFKGVDFTLQWASVYTFSCQRMASFRQGRVLFAGDAAHGVSPFRARGANSGLQDADNLAWKLAAVLRGQAPEALLDSYAREREQAADENIRQSTRSTDFITPRSGASRLFRDAVLQLARRHDFARRMVNSGRLSVPAVLHDSPLNTPDADAFAAGVPPGAVAADAPLAAGWLLRSLDGVRFAALLFGDGADALASLAALQASGLDLQLLRLPLDAAHRLAAVRYGARDGTLYLLRPDQHVCARWHRPTAAALRAAHARALAQP